MVVIRLGQKRVLPEVERLRIRCLVAKEGIFYSEFSARVISEGSQKKHAIADVSFVAVISVDRSSKDELPQRSTCFGTIQVEPKAQLIVCSMEVGRVNSMVPLIVQCFRNEDFFLFLDAEGLSVGKAYQLLQPVLWAICVGEAE